MSISQLLMDININLGPEEIELLEGAYNRTLQALHLVGRDDPIAEMIAKKIIEIWASGVRDPAVAIKQLGFQYKRN
jgi:hypothetical protein